MDIDKFDLMVADLSQCDNPESTKDLYHRIQDLVKRLAQFQDLCQELKEEKDKMEEELDKEREKVKILEAKLKMTLSNDPSPLQVPQVSSQSDESSTEVTNSDDNTDWSQMVFEFKDGVMNLRKIMDSDSNTEIRQVYFNDIDGWSVHDSASDFLLEKYYIGVLKDAVALSSETSDEAINIIAGKREDGTCTISEEVALGASLAKSIHRSNIKFIGTEKLYRNYMRSCLSDALRDSLQSWRAIKILKPFHSRLLKILRTVPELEGKTEFWKMMRDPPITREKVANPYLALFEKIFSNSDSHRPSHIWTREEFLGMARGVESANKKEFKTANQSRLKHCPFLDSGSFSRRLRGETYTMNKEEIEEFFQSNEERVQFLSDLWAIPPSKLDREQSARKFLQERRHRDYVRKMKP